MAAAKKKSPWGFSSEYKCNQVNVTKPSWENMDSSRVSVSKRRAWLTFQSLSVAAAAAYSDPWRPLKGKTVTKPHSDIFYQAKMLNKLNTYKWNKEKRTHVDVCGMHQTTGWQFFIQCPDIWSVRDASQFTTHWDDLENMYIKNKIILMFYFYHGSYGFFLGVEWVKIIYSISFTHSN